MMGLWPAHVALASRPAVALSITHKSGQQAHPAPQAPRSGDGIHSRVPSMFNSFGERVPFQC